MAVSTKKKAPVQEVRHHDDHHFTSLSIKDLIEARQAFHVHLMNKRNVFATAIGRYRIRKSDIRNGRYVPEKKYPREIRTLENSRVMDDISWPCILVFINKWEPENKLIHDGGNNIVPKSVYMPDGRVVPICVVLAPKGIESDTNVDSSLLNYPRNLIGGGFPLTVFQQGEKRIASVGCVVTDGNAYYALSNKHVVGKSGTPIYSVFRGFERRIGVSSGTTLGKEKFSKLYPGWPGESMTINNDVGLIEIDDINDWKTEIYKIGILGELYDLNTNNFSLDLIDKKLRAWGAVSGEIKGEIVALFYRYQSVGGLEYVSDFLIGGEGGKDLNVHHGDSGTVFVTEEPSPDNPAEIVRRPVALLWGQHKLMQGAQTESKAYVMATSLSNACRELDINIVRGFNIDQDYTWAKDGHFKIGNRSCELVSNTNLKNFLKDHKDEVGYPDAQLESQTGIAKAKSTKFIPLADVPDLYWRYYRFKTEGNNHFADMDESDSAVMGGKDLLELCKNDDFIDIPQWIDFYHQMDQVNPKQKKNQDTGKMEPAPRLGSLPFRVWQLYTQMVRSVQDGKLDEYLVAGGTMTHYVGDACQPLHVSYLHAGIPGKETTVHGDYEDKMIASNRKELFDAINGLQNTVKSSELITGGKGAAKFVIGLMQNTFDTLAPMEIIDAFKNLAGQGKYQKAWGILGKRTIKVIAAGSHAMAVLWQSAWVEGKGDAIAKSKYNVTQNEMMDLYKNFHFVQSYNITDAGFEDALENDTRK